MVATEAQAAITTGVLPATVYEIGRREACSLLDLRRPTAKRSPARIPLVQRIADAGFQND